jgi:hypothetical protein
VHRSRRYQRQSSHRLLRNSPFDATDRLAPPDAQDLRTSDVAACCLRPSFDAIRLEKSFDAIRLETRALPACREANWTLQQKAALPRPIAIPCPLPHLDAHPVACPSPIPILIRSPSPAWCSRPGPLHPRCTWSCCYSPCGRLRRRDPRPSSTTRRTRTVFSPSCGRLRSRCTRAPCPSHVPPHTFTRAHRAQSFHPALCRRECGVGCRSLCYRGLSERQRRPHHLHIVPSTLLLRVVVLFSRVARLSGFPSPHLPAYR